MHSIIPHLLLPPLLFLPFYLPPFPGRNLIFGTATLGVIAANTVNTCPDERTLRYGLSGSWIIYFPVLEKLLLHPYPERDFWRLDRRPHEAEYMGPFSLAKARWAAALLSSPRGVGWSHGSRKMPSGSEKTQGRLRFALDKVKTAVMSAVALEALLILNDNMAIPESWTIHQLPTCVLVDLLMGCSVYVTWTAQYSVLAGLSVAAGLSRPKDWPPIFGSMKDTDTLAGFWGSCWHSTLRQPSLGFSKAIVRQLSLPPPSNSAYMVHITTAFFFSSFWHILSIATIAEGHISMSRLIRSLSAFFMGQVPVIAAEHAFSQRRTDRRKKDDQDTTRNVEKRARRSLVRRGLGHVAVFTWLGLSGWLFVRVYRAVGLIDTRHPLPVIRPLLGLIGIKL